MFSNAESYRSLARSHSHSHSLCSVHRLIDIFINKGILPFSSSLNEIIKFYQRHTLMYLYMGYRFAYAMHTSVQSNHKNAIQIRLGCFRLKRICVRMCIFLSLPLPRSLFFHTYSFANIFPFDLYLGVFCLRLRLKNWATSVPISFV